MAAPILKLRSENFPGTPEGWITEMTIAETRKEAGHLGREIEIQHQVSSGEGSRTMQSQDKVEISHSRKTLNSLSAFQHLTKTLKLCVLAQELT